jgi:two-component system heavy metal sensor histidine kinase CusS
MLTRLDGAHQAQRRIIADTGHDIRTPITAMLGHLEVTLRADRTPEQYRQVLESCLEDVEQLVTISDSLMLLARLEAGEVQPTFQPTELAPLITAAAGCAHAHGSARTIQVEVDDRVAAPIDGDMLQIALNHLIGNAVQHTPPETDILIRASQMDGHLIITVDDSGPGIATEVLPKLFERMYRGDDARSRTGGTGLGLAITEEIVKAHGGSATADPSALGGLRITIRLPLRREARTPVAV